MNTFAVIPSYTREGIADIVPEQEFDLTVNTDILSLNPQNMYTVTFKPTFKEQHERFAVIKGTIVRPEQYLGRLATITVSWLQSQDYRTILDIADQQNV